MIERTHKSKEESPSQRLGKLRSAITVDTISNLSLVPLSNTQGAFDRASVWYAQEAVYSQCFALITPPTKRFNEVEFRHAVEDPITATYEIHHPAHGPIGHAQAHSIDWYSNGCTYGAFIGEEQYRGKGIGTRVRALMFSLLQAHGFYSVRFDIFASNIASLKSLSKFNPREITSRNPGERSFLLDLTSWQPTFPIIPVVY